jgi:hypothetical protein
MEFSPIDHAHNIAMIYDIKRPLIL